MFDKNSQPSPVPLHAPQNLFRLAPELPAGQFQIPAFLDPLNLPTHFQIQRHEQLALSFEPSFTPLGIDPEQPVNQLHPLLWRS